MCYVWEKRRGGWGLGTGWVNRMICYLFLQETLTRIVINVSVCVCGRGLYF